MLLVFLVMGFGSVIGPLAALAKERFQLSHFLAQMVPFAGFLVFGLISLATQSVPAKRNRKTVLITGLATMLAASLIPASFGLLTFPLMLVTVGLLGAGVAGVQVAAGPLVSPLALVAMGIGSFATPLLFVFADFRAVFLINASAILVTLLVVLLMPPGRTAAAPSRLRLLRHQPAVALSVYAGAEVALAAGIPLYLKDQFGIEVSTGLLGTALFLGALAIGRLSTRFLLRRMQPPTLFLAACLVSLISLLGLFVRNQSIAMASFALIGLGFANIAPLVSATFEAGVLPGLTGIPAAGGAIVPLIMGGLADRFGSVEAAFLVPVAALVYLTWVASAEPGTGRFSTKMTRKIAHYTLIAGAMAASSGAWAAPRDYRFDGKISREVLENYLSRSITMTEMYRSPGSLEDDLRMLKNIGAKFAGRTIYLWGREARINDSQFLGQGRDMIERVHRNDSDVVMQAAAFEIVTEEVNQISVPDWVFREFGQTEEKRNFDYSKMLFPDGKMVNHWRRGSSVPDICQPETKMWFYFLIGSYVNIGIEAIHVGQLDLMGRNDPEYRNWDDLLQRVRRYAARNARRHFVILDAHVPKGGPIVEGRLLLDFHSFPLRPKEVAGEPGKATLAIGYSDALYRRSRGGVTTSGWKCEHLPYLVEFDNFGGTRTPGEPSQTERPSIFTWGYDEITWFSHQPEEYRNEWLRYAWKWLKENDPDGFLQMPGGRMLTNGPTPWYFANTRSAALPRGFSQEETIKAIWSADR